MRVGTNINSIIAQRYVSKYTDEQALEDSKLSSGDRIVKSSVDPAGLAISETMKSKLRSNQQAERNSNDSISLMQVAEGSLGVMQGMGIRLRELAMQAANDTLGSQERVVIDKEFQQLKGEIERVTLSTSFNGNNIIKGKESVYDLQVGINGDVKENALHYDMGKVLDSAGNFGIANVDLRSKEGAQRSLGSIDKMMSSIGASRAQLGSMGNRITSVVQNLQISRENLAASNSKIRDADMAKEIAEKMKIEVAKGASLDLLKMSNDKPAVILKLVS